MTKILIVGAGLTGSLSGNLLRNSLGREAIIEVWEKSGGVCGRMTTSRNNDDPSLTCDLGLQYVTELNGDQYKSYYDELLKAGVLKRMDCRVDGMRDKSKANRNYVASQGAGSIPKHFLKGADVTLKTRTLLESIQLSNNKISALASNQRTKSGIKCEDADVVDLAMPVPQLLNLKGDFPEMMEGSKGFLEQVEYTSRYVLGVFYDKQQSELGLDTVECAGKYTPDDPCLCYLSIDNKKREIDGKGTSLVAHASVPFSMQHLEDSFEHVQPQLISQLHKLLPSLRDHQIASTKCLRWRYSQVKHPYKGEPGCHVINTSPLVVCAGDGFSQSNFEGCVKSAESVCATVSCFLKQ